MIYATIYKRLYRVLPKLDALIGDRNVNAVVLKTDGFMDLHVDILERMPDRTRISLAHYFKQGGDSISDPDMEVLIHHEMKMAEALSITQSFRPTQHVYANAERTRFYPARKKEQNSFLGQWLMNLIHQGHKLVDSDRPRVEHVVGEADRFRLILPKKTEQ